MRIVPLMRVLAVALAGSALAAPIPFGPSEPHPGPSSTMVFHDNFEEYNTVADMKVANGGNYVFNTAGYDHISVCTACGYGGSTTSRTGKAAEWFWPTSTIEQDEIMEKDNFAFPAAPSQAPEYFSFMYRTSPGFVYHTVSPRVGKKHFLLIRPGSLGARITNYGSGWSLMQTNGVKIDPNTYHLSLAPQPGDLNFSAWGLQVGDRDGFERQVLSDGNWHRFTYERVPETVDAAMNGSYLVWIDGNLVANYSDLGDGAGPTAIVQIFGTFNGGSSQDQYEWFDNFSAWYGPSQHGSGASTSCSANADCTLNISCGGTSPLPLCGASDCYCGNDSDLGFTPLPADVNLDHAVDVRDLIVLVHALGSGTSRADLNRDGRVDIFDLVSAARSLASGGYTPGTTPPQAPSNAIATLSGTNASGATYAFSWGSAAGATGYHVTAGYNDGSWSTSTDVSSTSTTLFFPYHADNQSANGYACVAATDSAGTSGTSCSPVSVPAPPTSSGGNTSMPLLFSDGFESGNLSAWDDIYNQALFSVTTAIAHNGTHALKVVFPAGTAGGSMSKFILPGYTQVEASMWVYYPNNFTGGSKLMLFHISNTSSPWSAFGRAGDCPNGTDFALSNIVSGDIPGGGMTFYTYYVGEPKEPDNVTCWGRYGTGVAQYYSPREIYRGSWHHIEFYEKLNTPGQNNSIQRFWLDGVLQGEWKGAVFRTIPDLLNTAFTIELSTSGITSTQVFYIDDVKVYGS